MAEESRVRSGIEGLDKLIEGGFPKGSFIVVSGGPGTGKTIMGYHFIASGAEGGERGVYISVEQTEKEIIAQAEQFGWDFARLKKNDKLDIVTISAEELSDLSVADRIKKELGSKGYRRMVIDSLTSFTYSPASPIKTAINAINYRMDVLTINEVRRANIASLIDAVKRTGITTLGLAQKIEGAAGDTLDMVSEFKGDGLIVLSLTSVGKQEGRTIHVKKMRKTNLKAVPYKFSFGKNGIVVTD